MPEPGASRASARPIFPDADDIDRLWSAPVKVRFAHCDPAGIAFFPRYFELLNGVVEDFFAERLGLDHAAFAIKRRIGLGFAHAEADFIRPCMAGDTLDVSVKVGRIGRSSVDFAFFGRLGRQPAFRARLTMVVTDLDRHRAIPIPDDLRDQLAVTGDHIVYI